MRQLRQMTRQRGSALAFALVVITGIVIVSGTAVLYGLNSTSVSSNQRMRGQLRGVAQSGVTEALHQLWDKYLITQTGQIAGTAASYQKWLNGIVANNATVTLENTTAGKTTLVVTATRLDANPGQNGTYVNIVSLASNNNTPPDTVKLTGEYLVGAPPWNGLAFALLTNNVNCIFCHAHFDNAARYYNTNSANYGTYTGARVAALQQVAIRTNQTNANSDSTIAGTLYTTNSVFSDDGNSLVPAGTANGSLSYETTANGTGPNLQFMQLNSSGAIMQDPANGKEYLEEASNTTAISNNMAELSTTQTSPTSGMSGGTLTSNDANVYIDYPTATSAQTDGAVPTTFPPVVPNASGDKYVDSSDWAAAAQGATGTLQGLATQVPFGSTLTKSFSQTETAPSVTFGQGAGQTNLNAGANGTGTNASGASVVLYGTTANPIVLSGTVAFPGDVIISGVVQGTGEILARGNLYVVSDLTYNDPGITAPPGAGNPATGSRNFGDVVGGTAQNAVAYAAGGNVLIGNYIDSYGGGSTLGSQQMSFSEASIFNRDQWAQTQVTLPSSSGQVSNVPPSVKDPTTGNPGTNVNGTYTPDYVPRFYTQENGNVYIAANIGPANANLAGTAGSSSNPYYYSATSGWYNGSASDIPTVADTQALKTSYLAGTSTINQDGSVTATAPANYLDSHAPAGTLSPAVLTLDPNTYGGTPWLSRSTMDTFTQAAMAARPNNRPLEIDGMVYTNNSIFAMAGVSGDNTGAQMLVNGALLSANTGILAPSGLQLNYDANTAQYINVKDTNQVALQVGWLIEGAK